MRSILDPLAVRPERTILDPVDPNERQRAPWVVLKFGGTSVASIQRWKTIAEVLRERVAVGERPVVVCSALAGESDLLESLMARAEAGEDIRPALGEVASTHRALARDMQLDADEVIGDLLDELERLARGAHMLQEASPRVRARIMSMGELMSTRLGAAWLETQGLRTSWQDAREQLTSLSNPHTLATSPERYYLSASCSSEADPALQERMASEDAQVWITQGFIASDTAGDTVLLGRGGSDTSAAYFAARLGALRLEIWTDVPGLFTANPRTVPDARLLRRLRYREAEEMALLGGRVLHPRCIGPVATHHIPLYVKCTLAPKMVGTIISSSVSGGEPRLKAVSLREGMQLFSVEPDRGLQNVGVLAESSSCFAKWNLSIDIVAASETSITFCIDPANNPVDETVVAGLLTDLRAVAQAREVDRGAALSLVGTNIHGIFDRLGPIFEYFRDHDVHMVSQAADDSNFTMVVSEENPNQLLRDVHARLFPKDLDDPIFGPAWNSMFCRGDDGSLELIEKGQ